MRPINPAICLLAATLALSSPAAAGGIDFASMPVGCSWTTKYSNGNIWIETFTGKKNGAYVIEVRESGPEGNLVSRKKYNKNGWMTERVWANGKWERFKPYSCFGEVGSCRYTYTNADGARLVMLNETSQSGQTFSVKGRIEGGDSFPEEQFTLGPFGITVTNKASNYSTRVTGFMNCDLPSS